MAGATAAPDQETAPAIHPVPAVKGSVRAGFKALPKFREQGEKIDRPGNI
jgi:hypothetical protein